MGKSTKQILEIVIDRLSNKYTKRLKVFIGYSYDIDIIKNKLPNEFSTAFYNTPDKLNWLHEFNNWRLKHTPTKYWVSKIKTWKVPRAFYRPIGWIFLSNTLSQETDLTKTHIILHEIGHHAQFLKTISTIRCDKLFKQYGYDSLIYQMEAEKSAEKFATRWTRILEKEKLI